MSADAGSLTQLESKGQGSSAERQRDAGGRLERQRRKNKWRVGREAKSCMTQEAQLPALWWPRWVEWGKGEREVQGVGIYISPDSWCCTAETNIIKTLSFNKT